VHRSTSFIAVIAGVASLLAIASVSPAARTRPLAHTATSCPLSVSEQRHLGPSYVTSLSVRGTSCSSGKHLVRAYYSCRVHSGGARGTCHRTVLGYHCHETRSGISVQFDARVSCVNGSRRVNHTYTQNT